MSVPSVSRSDSPSITPAVKTLIAVSVAVLFLQRIFFLDGILGFDWSLFVGKRYVWTAITYMFVHASPWYLAVVNMYALFVFGPRLEHVWGTRRFALFYLFCGIGALLCYVAFARDNAPPLIGSSGAVFGVMTAYAMQWPNDEIFFFGALPMRVWTMVILFVGVNLAMGLFTTATGVPSSMMYFAHLGGALAGWFYVRTPDTPSLGELRQRVSQVPDAEDPPRAIPRSHPRGRERIDEVDEIVARSRALAPRRVSNTAPNEGADIVRDGDMDRVLDKISEHGLDSLTATERHMLEVMSKRLRGN